MPPTNDPTPTTQSRSANIAESLRESARRSPDQPAIILPRRWRRSERRITFAELDATADRIAHGLIHLGVRPGHRLVLMVKPGIEFIALTFGIFRSGATAVLIDPGMGLKRVFGCLAEVEPDGFVAIPVVHAVRRLRRSLFPNARFNVSVGPSMLRGIVSYRDLVDVSAKPRLRLRAKPQEFAATDALPEVAATDPAAIIFTSGGTGPPKGVVYEHGMFAAQVELLREQFDVRPGEVDLPGFPLFALFDAAMQVTTVVPDIDPTRPAKVNPWRILDPIAHYGVTQAFGSPALWNRVGRHCERTGEKIPHLRRAISAGAPVPLHVLERMTKSLAAPAADLHTPYGATEALPVATIAASEVLRDTAPLTRRGAGTCVGRAFPRVQIKIIERTDEPIASLEAARELPPGEIGEIIVSSPSATREYFRRPRETALAKIADGDRFWHRMGDVGYLDEQDRLWFCGRKAHVVETADGPMYSVRCEAIFNEHPHVFRSALVGIGPRGSQKPVIVVEPERGRYPARRDTLDEFTASLRALAVANPVTQPIDTFLFRPSFPVDVRHNIKIDREQLARWAAMRLDRSNPDAPLAGDR